jgi:hypothetical protein
MRFTCDSPFRLIFFDKFFVPIVVGEDGPGHGYEMERSLMEGEDGLNCGVGDYRGYIELRRQGAETDGSR